VLPSFSICPWGVPGNGFFLSSGEIAPKGENKETLKKKRKKKWFYGFFNPINLKRNKKIWCQIFYVWF
jgi:hypothetical protein